MKLHLGCGKRFLPGFVHVDIIDYPHVDFVQDIRDLSFVECCSCDELYASHVLEHVERKHLDRLLAEWVRVLKPGGALRLAVPDFDAVVEHFLEVGPDAIDSVQGLIYGGQTHDYNFHHACYNFASLKRHLERHSILDLQRYEWRSFLPDGFDDYSRAYLPHMDFEGGKLMSLNVVGFKAKK